MNCIEFVEHYMGIKLFPFQKEILIAWENGYEVRTARGLGRSKLAEGYGKYITHKLENNNYEKAADLVFPYHYGIAHGLLEKESVDLCKELSEKAFIVEYECK